MTTSNVSKRVSLVAFLLLTTVLAPVFAQTSSYAPELDTFFKAFQAKDYVLIKSLLAPQVKIGDLPAGASDTVLHMMLERLPAPSSYSITNSVTMGSSTTVNTIYQFPGKPDSPQSFVFNSDGKITSFEVPKFAHIEVKVSTEERSVAVPIEANSNQASRHIHLPQKMEMPFVLSDNVPVVTAEINGKKGKFLLDSGSDDFILNSSLLKQDQLKTTNALGVGVGGAVALKTFRVDNFNWQGLTWSNVDVPVSSLSDLKDDKGHPIAGLIGYEVFKDYELTLDYARKKVILVLTDKNGVPRRKVFPKRHVLDTIHFKLQGTSPVFPMSIGDRIYRMCLDTGAGANLLYAKYFTDLKRTDAFVPNSVQKEGLEGIGQTVAVSDSATVKKATIGKTTYKRMEFIFQDETLNSLKELGLAIDGLVGYQFLKPYPTSINFKAGTITVYTKG